MQSILNVLNLAESQDHVIMPFWFPSDFNFLRGFFEIFRWKFQFSKDMHLIFENLKILKFQNLILLDSFNLLKIKKHKQIQIFEFMKFHYFWMYVYILFSHNLVLNWYWYWWYPRGIAVCSHWGRARRAWVANGHLMLLQCNGTHLTWRHPRPSHKTHRATLLRWPHWISRQPDPLHNLNQQWKKVGVAPERFTLILLLPGTKTTTAYLRVYISV